MAMIRIKCRQCAWESDLDEERVPRYGARIRCPQCKSLQSVTPYISEKERLRAPLAEMENVGSGTGSENRSDHRSSQVEERSVTNESSGHKTIRSPSAAEAREVIDIWLAELRSHGQESVTMAILFSEFSDELTHIFTLWKATYPGENSIRLFREQLMAALGEMTPDDTENGPVKSSNHKAGN
jgi:hypothetical protein